MHLNEESRLNPLWQSPAISDDLDRMEVSPDDDLKEQIGQDLSSTNQPIETRNMKQRSSSRRRTLSAIAIMKSLEKPKSEPKIRGRKVDKIEEEETSESVQRKAAILAQLIKTSKQTVIYTGAGISTSASIPDYRGPNGLWTQKKKTGTVSITRKHDLTLAKPTQTHMAIRELCRRRLVKHVVSQNCDGLHLRSGIPQNQLSEIHGNMYIEICQGCERQYFRQGDTTDKTARFRHKTGRKCHVCKPPNNELRDSIVLYGERSRSDWPMNWQKANRAADKADLIICIGSSLKTLRLYKSLWPKSLSKVGNKMPTAKLVIVNLQYTSKDKNAAMKIVANCDQVMQAVMMNLNLMLPEYDCAKDPLRHLAVDFTPEELAVYKRNLIFDEPDNQTTEGSPKETSHDGNTSPGFVEAMDGQYHEARDTSGEISPCKSESNDENLIAESIIEESLDKCSQLVVVVKQEVSEAITEVPNTKEYALPGWLSKGLGSVKTSTYKRKRRGNRRLRVVK